MKAVNYFYWIYFRCFVSHDCVFFVLPIFLKNLFFFLSRSFRSNLCPQVTEPKKHFFRRKKQNCCSAIPSLKSWFVLDEGKWDNCASRVEYFKLKTVHKSQSLSHMDVYGRISLVYFENTFFCQLVLINLIWF